MHTVCSRKCAKPSTVAVLLVLVSVPLMLCAVLSGDESAGASESAKHRSAFAVAFHPDGSTLAVSDPTSGTLSLVDVEEAKVVREVALRGQPSDVIWAPGGERIFVAERGAGTVAEVDPEEGKVLRRLKVGLRPVGLALAQKAGFLLATNFESDSLSVVALSDGKEKARIALERAPMFLTVSPDESLAVVANSLPAGAASNPRMSAVLGIVDLEKMECVRNVALPPGSANLRGVAISPDGRWAYTVHTVGRTQVPTTQLDRGWVNTNALSVVDLKKREHLATLLLDHPMEGAADPWGLALSADGRTLWTSLAGIHRVARVELATLHEFLEGRLPDSHRLAQTASYSPGTESIWLRIKKDLEEREELVNDLAALYAADLIERIKLEGRGPRGVALSPDGGTLAAAMYFSGSVDLLDTEKGKVKGSVALGPMPEKDLARRGEEIFHDATFCFQHWMSCATCHSEARMDAMNWDLLNDGIGNPKNTRSLLLSFKTPPAMSLGVRGSMEEAVKAGFIHIQFHQPEESTLEAVSEYLRSLEPQPSPHLLPDGSLSEAAERGEKIFHSKEAHCDRCHPGPLYTDLQRYNVGTQGELDRNSDFDTPTLIELYRTAPYLHDGSAATLEDLLVDRNRDDRHGKTSHLSPEEIGDLIQFLLSL